MRCAVFTEVAEIRGNGYVFELKPFSSGVEELLTHLDAPFSDRKVVLLLAG